MPSHERTMPWLRYCGWSSRLIRSFIIACHAATAMNQKVRGWMESISTNWQYYHLECLIVNKELYNKGKELYERELFSSVIGAKDPYFRFSVLIDEGGWIFD